MVTVSAGEVTLSDRRTERRWAVGLDAYQIAAVPVTCTLYQEVTGRLPDGQHRPGVPVTDVSWWEAVRFCNSVSQRDGLDPVYRLHDDGSGIDWNSDADGYRLPTEAEWEHACRAGTSGPRYGSLETIAWYRDNADEQIHDVAGREPNPWGLYDMLGNAWDWCWDIYDAEVYGSYRVLRGGGWFDEHWSCRASVRRRSHPSLRLDDVGFRLARSRTA